MVMDPTGKIDNAGTATITQAVSNGYVSGTLATGVTEVSQPDATVSLFPNPSDANSSVYLQMTRRIGNPPQAAIPCSRGRQFDGAGKLNVAQVGELLTAMWGRFPTCGRFPIGHSPLQTNRRIKKSAAG